MKTTKTAKATKAKKDIQQDITDAIIKMIESGVKNGGKLWDNAAGVGMFRPTNATTGKPYSGVNRFHLAMVAMNYAYPENKWVTYKQAADQGWQVRKGEKSVSLCYYSSYTKENKTTGEDETKMFLKGFNVFNVSQLDGYVSTIEEVAPVMTTAENCELIQTILAKTDVKFMPEMGDMAFYSPSHDAIQLPPKSCFTSNNAYYSVMLHELTHSTLHDSRLGRGAAYRELYKTRTESYAREELVAELGAAFLGAEIGCLQENLEFHASYLGSWLSALKSDKKAIFKACADAQKATDFIMENWVNDKATATEEDQDQDQAQAAA